MARLPNFLVIIRSEKLSGKGQGRGCLGVRKKERFVLGKRTFRSQKSKHFVLRIIHISPASLPYKTLAGLAQLYMKKGQKERADSLFQNALLSKDLPLRAYIYNQLYDEAWKTENYKKIAQYARLYIDTSDSIYNSHLHQEVLKVQRKYDHMQLLYQKSRQANIIYSFVIIISMVSGILCFLFIQYKKKRRK